MKIRRLFLVSLFLWAAPVRLPAPTCPTCTLLNSAATHVNIFSTNTEGPIINSMGLANSLLQKLHAAIQAGMAGNARASLNIVGAFENEVAAQTNHHINLE